MEGSDDMKMHEGPGDGVKTRWCDACERDVTGGDCPDHVPLATAPTEPAPSGKRCASCHRVITSADIASGACGECGVGIVMFVPDPALAIPPPIEPPAPSVMRPRELDDGVRTKAFVQVVVEVDLSQVACVWISKRCDVATVHAEAIAKAKAHVHEKIRHGGGMRIVEIAGVETRTTLDPKRVGKELGR